LFEGKRRANMFAFMLQDMRGITVGFVKIADPMI
jgi:hypothetical protein